MREIIKRYELKDGVTQNDIQNSGLKYTVNGITAKPGIPRYYCFKHLCSAIELHIEIIIGEDGSLIFDDFKSVYVLDEDFCQPYGPFYNDKLDAPVLNNVIKRYNAEMDKLVEKGIFVEKVLENIETDEKSSKESSRKRKKA